MTNAIVGIDLADAKQMTVVTDHDSRVLARKTFRVRAWDLGAALDWAAIKAAKAGFTGVTIACEPTGHPWRILGQLAAERSMAFVCVQPLISARARRREDLTTDKTDEKDAVIIARPAAQLRCYAPEPVDETWGWLRHLGARRERLLAELIAQVQQMRDLLERVWPAVLEAANYPFRSRTWAATMSITLERDGGDFARTKRLGLARLENLVREEVRCWSAVRPTLRITRTLFAALEDRAGVIAHRRGALERVGFVLEDWFATRWRRADVEGRMSAVLDELELTQLVTSIPGLSAIGAATILAGTGDLHRFASARALVKHAGLAGHLGNAAQRPRPRRPLPEPDHPGAQPLEAHPSPSGPRRGVAAATARRDRHRPALETRHRHSQLASAPPGGRRTIS
ncbi:IS110 family transposase [Kineococcus sp. TRM81007]|uniref:IS110 family transposase n=1 Tax=Kineococcus sp. TRM81007 TaxID=2925831 RepID=UPI001F59FF5E|nr:IS110 family transposase [Kineococcus sp. TRM81007]MCI2239114.1 IS110 family transposase [Kineococcus sp. TRM81007]